MNKNIIYFDTNIIQHSIQHPNKEYIIEVHKKNLNFYWKSKCLIVSQVDNELFQHGVNLSDWLGSFISLDILPDTLEYSKTLHHKLYMFFNKIITVYKQLKNKIDIIEQMEVSILISELNKSKEKLKELKHILSDICYYYECCGNEWFYWISQSAIKNKLNTLWIDYKLFKTSEDVWLVCWRIIELTNFWLESYYWITYKDINRMIGNFMFDYKNFKWKKSDTQRHKVGKDAAVIIDLIHSIYKFNIDISQSKTMFITSDYAFYKELIKFKRDVLINNLLNTENYCDLSYELKTLITEVISKLNILKLNLSSMLFENESWNSSLFIQDLV